MNGLEVILIDSLTIDPVGVHTAHKALTKNKLVVESLPYSYLIPPQKRNNLIIQVGMLQIEGATGAAADVYVYTNL